MPSFNNYFGQQATKLGFQNGGLLNPGTRALGVGSGSGKSNAKSKGYCESSFVPHNIWMCNTFSLNKFYPEYNYVDNCDRPNGYIPYPYYIFSYGCHCECVLQSDYPDYDPDCYPCLDCSACCTIFHCTQNEKFPLRNSTTHPVLMSNHHLHNILLLMPYNNSKH